MQLQTTVILSLFGACVQVVLAQQPPACLLAALNQQPNPADMKALCSAKASDVQKAIQNACSGADEPSSLDSFTDSCKGAGFTIKAVDSDSSSSASASATGSASASASASGNTKSTSNAMPSSNIFPMQTSKVTTVNATPTFGFDNHPNTILTNSSGVGTAKGTAKASATGTGASASATGLTESGTSGTNGASGSGSGSGSGGKSGSAAAASGTAKAGAAGRAEFGSYVGLVVAAVGVVYAL
ncbi:hypothetical protein EJ08DRAFT_733921 [Tothia fuscella]|uniref:GPI anchored cell wall protein n=1 Tax=Tothia fuscella TaxID=1048955 RepID=A0A9P4TZ90_9PEZI|nr:hypothetical protein EJ08DRAFT_733921 [Tothia fuscella]